jgi:Pyruvate/2-oxoacid:ferredoxin oxidoreductase delta subunit
MKRTIIKIDEDKCTGCGLCVDGCHEGALQIIDGKARMVSDLFCDGLGACIGECPVDAIELEEREAEPYDEYAVMDRISPKGEKTIRAHLLHLKDHNELEYLKQGLNYLREHNIQIDMTGLEYENGNTEHGKSFGCPGKKEIFFETKGQANESTIETSSQLRQWPVQLHLLNPEASYLKNADVVLAADCTAFAYGDFHNRFLKNRILAIACPKLDNNKENYVEKLATMIDRTNINTLTVVMMEVPCCSGLLQLAQQALSQAKRKIPIKKIIISLQGNILQEEWI